MNSLSPSLDLSTLTPKQQDMAMARNPMANNELNALSMQERAINKEIDDQRKGLATQEQAEKQGTVAKTPTGIQGGQVAGATQRNLATFSNRVSAKINQFLSGGDVNKLSLDLPQDMRPKWNPATNQFEIPDMSDVGFSTEEIARIKAQQAQAIKDEMSPYFHYTQIGDQTVTRAKGFDEILKQFADLNNDGFIDSEEERYLNEAMKIARDLQRYRNLNPSSPEAQALRMELELLDSTGLVSGIHRAMEQYSRISGEDLKGPTLYDTVGREDLNLERIVNMTTESIQEELIKALTGQESIFMGDFESELTSNRLRTNLEKSLAFDSWTRTALASAATEWGKGLEQELIEYKDQISEGFKSTFTEKIPAHFERLKAEAESRGESTAPLDAALQWFANISESNDPAQAIFDLLNNPDSGLAVNQRMMLAKWLGDITGNPNAARSGLIKSVLDGIAQKGYVNLQSTNSNGEPEDITVEFTDQDRVKIARILQNDTLSNEQKNNLIYNMIDAKMEERLAHRGDIAAIQRYFEEGSFNAGLEAFAESIVMSLNTFNNSATQFFWDKVVEERPGEFTSGMGEGEDPRSFVRSDMLDSVQAAAQDHLKLLVKQMEDNAQIANDAIDARIEQAQKDLDQAKIHQNELNTALRHATQQTHFKISETIIGHNFEANTAKLVNGFKNVFRKRGFQEEAINNMKYWEQLTPVFEVYTMLENLNHMANMSDAATKNALQSHPLYGQMLKYINNPLQAIQEMEPFTVTRGLLYTPITRPNPDAIALAQKIQQEILTIVRDSSREIVVASSFGKAIESKRNSIDESIERANNFLTEADNYKTQIELYVAAGKEQLANSRIHNPNEVANMAMAVARAAEAGIPNPVQFINMNVPGYTRNDFEKLVAGDQSVRPMYAGYAVQSLSDPYKYEVSTGPGIRTDLEAFGQTYVKPTPVPEPIIPTYDWSGRKRKSGTDHSISSTTPTTPIAPDGWAGRGEGTLPPPTHYHA